MPSHQTRTSTKPMTITSQNNWLLIQLDQSEINPDLDWSELVKWKIPPDEMRFLPERNAWLVKRRHGQLISTLHLIYTVLTEENPPLVVVKQASRMVENIERWYPVGKEIPGKVSDFLGSWKEDVGRN